MYRGAFDGASSGNPGPGGAGVVIVDCAGEIVAEIAMFLGDVTNNEAEYMALILLIEKVVELGIRNIEIEGDSKLVVNQVCGKWQARQAHIRKLHRKVLLLLEQVPNWSLCWVPREQNRIADSLSRKALLENVDRELFEGELQKVADGIYLAFSVSGNVYAVDLNNSACTCASFIRKNKVPCKHMLAVLDRNKGEDGLSGEPA